MRQVQNNGPACIMIRRVGGFIVMCENVKVKVHLGFE
jgi:ribosomal protein L36